MMQFKTVALLAVTGIAMAAPEAEKRQASIDPISLQSVLFTALPPSLLNIGLTNPGQVTSIISSQFAASQTPTWFTALPTDIQSYLRSLGASAAATASAPIVTATDGLNASAIAGAQSSLFSQISSYNASVISAANNITMNSTASVSTTTSGATSGAAGGASSSSSHSSSRGSGSSAAGASATSSSSAGGAALPTAVVGAGIAGALGLVGLLAL